jgi:hypothetical protein
MGDARFSSPSFSSNSASNTLFPSTISTKEQSIIFPNATNKAPNPILGVVRGLFEIADQEEQKALLGYLFQYQHANADLSPSEMDRFGLHYPVYKMQPKPGYVRTSPHLYHLVLPFIKDNLSRFFGNEDPEKYVDLSASLACDVFAIPRPLRLCEF